MRNYQLCVSVKIALGSESTKVYRAILNYHPKSGRQINYASSRLLILPENCCGPELRTRIQEAYWLRLHRIRIRNNGNYRCVFRPLNKIFMSLMSLLLHLSRILRQLFYWVIWLAAEFILILLCWWISFPNLSARWIPWVDPSSPAIPAAAATPPATVTAILSQKVIYRFETFPP
jgi:hypothetical protein